MAGIWKWSITRPSIGKFTLICVSKRMIRLRVMEKLRAGRPGPASGGCAEPRWKRSRNFLEIFMERRANVENERTRQVRGRGNQLEARLYPSHSEECGKPVSAASGRPPKTSGGKNNSVEKNVRDRNREDGEACVGSKASAHPPPGAISLILTWKTSGSVRRGYPFSRETPIIFW